MSLCINPNCSSPNNRDTQLFCQSCGAELLLEGRYRVIQQLGKGGFGKTYEVSDRYNTLQVLKVMTRNYPKYIELFQQEAEVLAKLNHPGIPKVEADAYFTFEPPDFPYPLHCLVMEKIEGLNLQEYIHKRGSPIKQKRAIQWLMQLVCILQEVHSQNFFHRDIKPSNIMLRSDGQLVLIDFGTAREITNTLIEKQSIGQVTGVISAGYTPPEQINGKAVPQSDFFALGRTFIYLLTEKDPNEFYNPALETLDWREATPDLSPTFADFLDYLMARLPSQRPQNTEEIWQKLIEINLFLYPNQTQVPGVNNTIVNEKTSVDESSITKPLLRQNEPYSLEEATKALPQNPPPKTRQNLNSIDSSFLARCQQELAEFIGPMAKIICQRTFNNNQNISPQDFVKALAKQIPDPQQASEFQRRLNS